MKQLSLDDLFKPNGNISPCPYTEECSTYGVGCKGESWWCNQKGIKIEKKPIPSSFKDYIGRCEFCDWGVDEITCQWSNKNPSRHKYGGCECGSKWMPDVWKIPKLCGGCRWHNDFHYQGEDIDHPIEEPNIYCTRPGGSINRIKPYQEFEEAGFGVGTWHRQHEFDSCEGWEASEYFETV